jgi:hypothetical protein
MKTILLCIWTLAGMLAIRAQTYTGDCTFGDCGPDYTTDCGSSTNWSDVIDFDGDGRPDFFHLKVVRRQYCALILDPDNVQSLQRDTVEALFPQEGVEMYLLDHADVPPILKDLEFIETDGSLPFLHGFQPVRWVWNPTYPPNSIRHSGLGICEHHTEQVPCGQIPICDQTTQVGWLRAQNPGIFGFRVSKPDGWHLGWFKLEELTAPITRPDGKKSLVKLVDYAVHRDPDTEIRAGEKARPALTAQFTGGGTLLSWSTNWPGWTLSWSPTLNPVAWAPVEGVATNTNRVTLTTTNASGFFRLQETP